MRDLDNRLRDLAVALVDESPAVPTFDELPTAVLDEPQPRSHRPTRVLVAAVVVLAVVVVIVVLARNDHTSTTQQPIGHDAIAGRSAGEWSGARTNKDGRQLFIVFTGGPTYDKTNPCSVKYEAAVRETKHRVLVRVVGSGPPGTAEPDCTQEGHYRHVTVPLEQPLGKRSLINSGARGQHQPVFDGATLVKPGWLPPGWRLAGEGGGYPDPHTGRYWRRTWSPPPTASQNGRCTPTSRGTPIELTQGPADGIEGYPNNGEKPMSSHNVRGATATYSVNPTTGSSTLSWTHRGQAFVVATGPGCIGDIPTSPDTTLRFARSLSPV